MLKKVLSHSGRRRKDEAIRRIREIRYSAVEENLLNDAEWGLYGK